MKKKIPNPNGKKGGEKHQKGIREVAKNIEDKDLEAIREKYFKNPDGKSRYADVVAFNKTGDIEEIHQVGKQNKNGTPVKRERDAMADIEKLSNKKVNFHPYNIIIIVALIVMAAIVIY